MINNIKPATEQAKIQAFEQNSETLADVRLLKAESA
jgi:hypothetical protein